MADRGTEPVNQEQGLAFTTDGVLNRAIAPYPGVPIQSEAIKNSSHRQLRGSN
jgi:hypothetical protein